MNSQFHTPADLFQQYVLASCPSSDQLSTVWPEPLWHTMTFPVDTCNDPLPPSVHLKWQVQSLRLPDQPRARTSQRKLRSLGEHILIVRSAMTSTLLHIINRYLPIVTSTLHHFITMSNRKGKSKATQKDSVVDQSFSDAEQARSAEAKSLEPTDAEAKSSSAASRQQKPAKALRVPALERERAPWPREESRAPISFKIFCEGLKELRTFSNNYVKSSVRMKSCEKYWMHVLNDLYEQAKNAGQREKTAMDEDLSYFKDIFGGDRTADLRYPLICTGKRMDRSNFYTALID